MGETIPKILHEPALDAPEVPAHEAPTPLSAEDIQDHERVAVCEQGHSFIGSVVLVNSPYINVKIEEGQGFREGSVRLVNTERSIVERA